MEPIAARNSPSPPLVAEHITFAYHQSPVLQDVSLELRRGEVLAIVGPNGSGKSTLLRILTGSYTPSAGAVLLGNTPLSAQSSAQIAAAIAYVPQHVEVAFGFTVREVVQMGRWACRSGGAGSLLGLPNAGDHVAVAEALASMGLVALADRNFRELSGGEQQRTAIARALAQAAPILLLDEPTSSLDLHHQMQLAITLRNLAANGQAVGLVTHDLNFARRWADRAAVLEAGRIKITGPVAEALNPVLLQEVYCVKVTAAGGWLAFEPLAGSPAA